MIFTSEISLDEQITEIQREIAIRQRVYPKWIKDGKLSKEVAERRIVILNAVLVNLQELEKQNQPQKALFS